MKNTLSTHDIANALNQDENGGWTYAGALAMAGWLEEMEEGTGEEMELDVVAIRCDFSEFPNLTEWAADYFGCEACDVPHTMREKGADIDEPEEGDSWGECAAQEAQVEEAIREYINDNGQLIEFEGGIIVSGF